MTTPLPQFTLASGREIRLEKLIIEDCYAGTSSEDPEELRAEVISGHVKLIETVFDEDAPLLLVEPPEGLPPRVAMIAGLVSDEPVSGGSQGAMSYLVVCWYRDEFPADALREIDAVIHEVDWDGNAMDFQW